MQNIVNYLQKANFLWSILSQSISPQYPYKPSSFNDDTEDDSYEEIESEIGFFILSFFY